jgi:hypothetical protein
MLPFFCVHLDPTSSICFFRLRKRSFGLFLIRIQIQDLDLDSNPDPKPDPNPKLTKGRIRIRNRIRNKSFGSATLIASLLYSFICIGLTGKHKAQLSETVCGKKLTGRAVCDDDVRIVLCLLASWLKASKLVYENHSFIH